jgi:hypothetical protein
MAEEETFVCEFCLRCIPSANKFVHQARCAASRQDTPQSHHGQQQQHVPEQEQTEQSRQDTPQSHHDQQQQHVTEQEQTEHWECQHCTFSQNPSNTQTCALCEAPRDRSQWGCEMCTYMNFLSASQCSICGNPRPDVRIPDARYTDRLLTNDYDERLGSCNVRATRNERVPPSSDYDTTDLSTQVTRGAILGAVTGAAVSYVQGRSIATGALQGASIAALSTLLTHNSTNVNNGGNNGWTRSIQDNDDPSVEISTGPIVYNSNSSSRRTISSSSSNIRSSNGATRPGGNIDNAALIFEAMVRDLVLSHSAGELQPFDGLSRDELVAHFETDSAPARVGASDAVIDSLPTRTVSTTSGDHASCLICMEEFGSGEITAVKTLPCLHQYCVPCIDRWLRQSATCPVCKHPL